MMDHLCGAHWSPDETEAAQAYFSAASESISPAPLKGYRDGESVCLWDAETQLFGRTLPSWIQTIGTCVGMGCGRAIQDSMFWALAFGDQLGDAVEVAWEPLYGLARTAKDIGNGRMGSNPSGNYPSWFARAYHEYGLPIRQKYGTIDLSTQRENLAAQWCQRGHATPTSIVDSIKTYNGGACYWPQSVEEILGCIRAGYAVARAGNYSTGANRDKNGYCGLDRCGGHCQFWRGVIVMKNGNVFIAEQQSWPGASAPHGENYTIVAETGREIRLPEGCGLIDLADATMVLKNGEVIAFGPPRNLWRNVPGRSLAA